jgi:hypothetical protein
MNTTPVLLVALLSFSCAGTAGRQVEKIQAGLFGLEGRRIVSCIGAPERIDRLDASTGHELWRYQMPLEADRTDWAVTDEPFPDEPTRARPLPGAVPPLGVPRPLEIPQRPLERDPDRPGLCRFVFELEGGSVRALEVVGETPEGLTADNRCARLLRRCVPQEVP